MKPPLPGPPLSLPESGGEKQKRYIYIYIHTYITYIHIHTHTHIQTYRHTDIQTYRHTDIHTYIHTYIHRRGLRKATPLSRNRCGNSSGAGILPNAGKSLREFSLRDRIFAAGIFAAGRKIETEYIPYP